MSKRGDIEFLDDISEAIRRLEIIGEAAKNITDELKEKHPQILWKDVAGIRDKLIHHYFGVNMEIVWTVIDEDLPQLRKEIRQVKENDKQ
jgi:uncharacterized protein with HEPN domain